MNYSKKSQYDKADSYDYITSYSPMTRLEYLLLALFCSVAILGISELHQHLSSRVSPLVVLKSLPVTKIKCDDSAISGHCAQFNISVKEWEGMQK